MEIGLIIHYFKNLTKDQKERFQSLYDLYIKWNSKVNLVSRKDIHQLMERHVLHSLAIAKVIQFENGSTILDLGTGGGFPGIPLAILFPDCFFDLIDSIGKKIKATTNIAHALGLKNVNGIHGRAESLNTTYDHVISRAVAPSKKLLSWTERKISKPRKAPSHLFLKGGDLSREVQDIRYPTKLVPIHNFFQEDFFKKKYVLSVTIP